MNLLRFIVNKGLPRAIKSGLNLLGIEAGHLRAPLKPLDPLEVIELKNIIENLEEPAVI